MVIRPVLIITAKDWVYNGHFHFLAFYEVVKVELC